MYKVGKRQWKKKFLRGYISFKTISFGPLFGTIGKPYIAMQFHNQFKCMSNTSLYHIWIGNYSGPLKGCNTLIGVAIVDLLRADQFLPLFD